MEKELTIHCHNIRLAGMIDENDPDRAVLVTHPHPLYGGNMDHPVVMAIVESFALCGFSTLRFNFRGTGTSTGMFDNGQGEQEDVKAALDDLSGQGFESIVLAGYSFGSRVNASVVSSIASKPMVTDHIMVSPPLAFMSFEEIELLPRTGLVVTGENDEIAPPEMVKAFLEKLKIQTRLEIIDHCDHFYSTGLQRLKEIIQDYL